MTTSISSIIGSSKEAFARESVAKNEKAKNRYSDALLRRVLGQETNQPLPVLKLRRTQSLPDLRTLVSRDDLEMIEEEEMARKTSAMWDCVDVIDDIYGGKLYSFQIKREFDAMQVGGMQAAIATNSISNEIFPAIEPHLAGANSILNTTFDINAFGQLAVEQKARELCEKVEQLFSENKDPSERKNKIVLEYVHHRIPATKVSEALDGVPAATLELKDYINVLKEWTEPLIESGDTAINNMGTKLFLNELGFRVFYDTKTEKFTLTLPDREAFLARYSLARQNDPDLPELHVASSQGIATDLEYTWGYFTHDALLSDGKEFVHDELTHLRLLIALILSAREGERTQAYKQNKHLAVTRIASVYKNIAKMPDNTPWKEIDGAILGVFVDNLSARKSYVEFKNLDFQLKNTESGLAKQQKYADYYTRRFHETPDATILKNFWSLALPAQPLAPNKSSSAAQG